MVNTVVPSAEMFLGIFLATRTWSTVFPPMQAEVSSAPSAYADLVLLID